MKCWNIQKQHYYTKIRDKRGLNKGKTMEVKKFWQNKTEEVNMKRLEKQQCKK